MNSLDQDDEYIYQVIIIYILSTDLLPDSCVCQGFVMFYESSRYVSACNILRKIRGVVEMG